MTSALPSQPAPDLELRVSQYVQLRDKKRALKKKHEEELAPYDEALDALEAFILGWLQNLNVQNIKTDAGTAYISHRVSATVADGAAFWDHVLNNQAFDLIDKRANAPAVSDYVAQHGAAPPGINYNVMLSIGVRRA